MASVRPQVDNNLNLEAPGDLLSGLLAVCELQSELLHTGDVRTFSAVPGQWRVLAPLSGSLDLAWADRSWTLEAHQAAAFPGGEGLSLLARENASVLFLALCGHAADRVFENCRRLSVVRPTKSVGSDEVVNVPPFIGHSGKPKFIFEVKPKGY